METFLYYGRAVDGTMLTALSAIASEQASPTVTTMRKAKKVMNYAATHPDAVLKYRRSDMQLAVHNDAPYLSTPKAQSRAGGHFFLANDVPILANNGAVLNTANLIKTVMSSAAEAEMGAIFLSALRAGMASLALRKIAPISASAALSRHNGLN